MRNESPWTMKDCPSDDTLADFVENRLFGAALAEFYEHVSQCPACTATLAALARSPSDKTVPSAHQSETSASDRSPNVEKSDWTDRPEIGGRYRTLDVLGAGGMGIVYLARDTQLNRNVALKVTRAGLPKGGVLRMFREAQAMAQLSHRNVVTVHDVGVWNDRVFVAMEHLEGGTLARYLLEQSPNWREILEKFIQAGHGLAAAHRAGIVHRDFKPENVLLSATSEVRVADFGLARWSSETGECSTVETKPSATPSIPESVRRARLTRVGTLVGTPAYMPPEQIKGAVADHRADLWSFCAALYEALYSELPFPGRTPREVLKYVERSSVRAPPIGSDIPHWLRQALLRGLRVDPANRYPNMEELLDTLSGKGARQRKRWVVSTSVVALTLASVSFYLFANRERSANAARVNVTEPTAPSAKQTRKAQSDAPNLPGESDPSDARSATTSSPTAPQRSWPTPPPPNSDSVSKNHVVTQAKRTSTQAATVDTLKPPPPSVATASFRENTTGAPIIHD
jgi:serine/threonine protein kinase